MISFKLEVKHIYYIRDHINNIIKAELPHIIREVINT